MLHIKWMRFVEENVELIEGEKLILYSKINVRGIALLNILLMNSKILFIIR